MLGDACAESACGSSSASRVLRRLREARGLSQEATAQAAGIALNTYSRIERGQTSPSWPTVRQLANALGVSMGDLGAAVEAEH
jgi:transcriptional regulator with XRE-family HTH domain